MKYDITKSGSRVVAEAKMGPNTFGGEAVFAPRADREEDMKGEVVRWIWCSQGMVARKDYAPKQCG